uniref:Uncharacterized protein n=1 Tax=Lactuca sativa TaxID=4236 RepID=A0A9R1VBA7_LACSA|nr:hypothetical protein LSAT_V11C600312540 [Lactuca sativa]
MACKISGTILNHLITCIRTLFDHIYFLGRLTIILTSYAEMFVRWQATMIPPEISSLFSYDIYRVFDFKRTCVVDLNRYTCSCGNVTSVYLLNK